MKVLYITHCRCMLGANKCLLNMMLDMRKRKGVEPYVILPVEIDGEFAEILEQNQIPYFVVPFKRWVESTDRGLRTLHYLHKERGNIKVYQNALQELKQIGFDLIHTNSSNVQFGAWLSERLGIPHIWHVREFNEEDYQISIIYPKKKIEEAFQKSFSVIAISEAIREKYQSKYCHKARIDLIYDGIEGEWNPVEKAVVSKDDTMEFVCTGVLSEKKGQLLLIEACHILKEKGITGFHVSLIGDGEADYVDSLKKKARSCGLEEIISFLGKKEEIRPILQKSHVGVTPSSKEAFGRVTVEYMLEALPVIGANTGGTKEIVIDNETGILFEADKSESLAEGMLQYLEHRELVSVHGRNAYNRAMEHFTLSSNTDSVYALYKEAVNCS